MFKYQIVGRIDRKTKPVTVALTSFRDIALFIKDHAVEALDPTGENGLSFEINVKEEADDLIYPPKRTKSEKSEQYEEY